MNDSSNLQAHSWSLRQSCSPAVGGQHFFRVVALDLLVKEQQLCTCVAQPGIFFFFFFFAIIVHFKVQTGP